MLTQIIKKTPLEYCSRLSKKYGCNVLLKREDTQIVRSFKIRGALNKIIKNKQYNITSYVTASAGNHAQGVAFVCNKLDINCSIFVPDNTPLQKISRIKHFSNNNCKLVIGGNNFNDALGYAYDYCNTKSGSLLIHPYDDLDVIDGQGNIATEILEDTIPDIVIVPIGGGGLIAGILSKIRDSVVYGVEPIGAASMTESIRKNKVVNLNKIDTFVDGASISEVGSVPFNIINYSYKLGYLKEIFKVSNGEICNEMINLYQNEGIITEPAGALAVSALPQLDREYIKDKTVVCIVSGGNNDIMRYPEIVEKSLRHQKLKHYFIITFKQKPGQLKQYVREILTQKSDITRFEYIKKNNKNSGSVLIGIELHEPGEINIIKQNMIKNNFEFIQLLESDLLYNYLI